MKKATLILTSFTLLASLAPTLLQATILADYSFDGSVYTSFDTDTDTSAGAITAGAGITLALDTELGSANPPSLETTFASWGKDLATSIADDDYYAFTLNPEATTVNFESISFNMFKQSGAGANVTAHVFSSADSFTNSLGSAALIGKPQSGAFLSRSVDISTLTGINSAITFRIYVDNGDPSFTGNDFRLDDIELNGTIVPEASAAFIGLGAAFIMLRRRR